MEYLVLSRAILYDVVPDDKMEEMIVKLQKWNDNLLNKYDIEDKED